MFKSSKNTRFLAAILLIAALIPGATVFCLSSTGYVALESQFAACLATAPAPLASGEPVSVEANQGCADCSDVLVLATGESRFRHPSPHNNQPVFVPVAPVTVSQLLSVFEQTLFADAGLSSPNPSSPNPLRC